MHLLPAVVAGVILACVEACTIEPPLKLADSIGVEYGFPEVITDLEIIWDLDSSWRDEWWYGWDADDERYFGTLDYPVPRSYEARIFFIGADRTGPWLTVEQERMFSTRLVRRFPFGWHDMLLWSNVYSPTGTQVLLIDESDPHNIHATTTTTRLSYQLPSRTSYYNNPEIFYAGMPETFYVSRDPADYDYFDEARNVYVKHIEARLTPLVYTYLVQVVLYNNHQRIIGQAERASVTSLADGVSLHTGHTTNNDIAVAYDMRLKRDLPARGGAIADIFGGKLTTFGLCDMESWSKSRATRYGGSRGELTNHVAVNFRFANSSDSVYMFNVTPQIQRQSHGGVITIEIDVDTLTIPKPGSHASSSGFKPYIAPGDTVSHEFIL